MRRKRAESQLEQVELVGIPHYAQGEADGLCVYYAMGMMLAALHPAWGPAMHEPPRHSWKGSPVFQGLRRLYQSERLYKEKVADWFFNGLSIVEATRVLNRFFQQHFRSNATYFIRRPVRARRVKRLKYSRRKRAIARTWTAGDVINAISWHLPVIVAGGGLGSHAVLAVGYSVRGRGDRWISFLDPAQIRPEWRACGDVFFDDAEIIMPEDAQFQEYRPPRVITVDGTPEFQRWEPRKGAEQQA